MPVGYVITLLIIGLCLLSALAPIRRPRPLREVSFRLGVILNEAPFLVFALLLLSTVLALVEGDLDAPWAWALLAVALLEAAGLLVVLRRGLAAGPAVRAALDAGLGTGRAASAPAGSGDRPGVARILALPVPITFRGRERNVPYGDAGRENLLDVYRPLRGRGGPLLIFMHGGGYHGGTKSRESRALFSRLTRRGWTCVSANYRLRPKAGFREHLVDMKKVIAWSREHGPGYGADPDNLFVAGSSAGGHLAALAALTQNDPDLQPGFERSDTAVSGAICLSAYLGNYYGAAARGERTSPFDFIRSGPPPFFIAHGELDSSVPAERARAFAAALDRAVTGPDDGPIVYAELPGGQHSFDLLHSFRYEAVIDGIVAFTDRVLDRADADRPDRLSRSYAR